MTIRSPSRGWAGMLAPLVISACLLGDRPGWAGEAADDPVRRALGQGGYPWYDAPTDQVRTLKLPSPPVPPAATGADSSGPLGSGGARWAWPDYLVFGGFVAALATLTLLVIRYWKRYEPTTDGGRVAERPEQVATTATVLPAALRGADPTGNPWAEANRRRLAGDFAGAVVCLFAHQLLTLARLDLVRLAPGRTGRQLHRAIADAEFRDLMVPTLRQFEAVFYGHRDPTAPDFAVVWEAAEAFERRAATRVAG